MRPEAFEYRQLADLSLMSNSLFSKSYQLGIPLLMSAIPIPSKTARAIFAFLTQVCTLLVLQTTRHRRNSRNIGFCRIFGSYWNLK